MYRRHILRRHAYAANRPRSALGMFTLNSDPSSGSRARICSTTCRARPAPREKSSGRTFTYSCDTAMLVRRKKAPSTAAATVRNRDVDARVRAGVQAAHNHVRRFRQQLQQGQLHAVGRPAFHGPAHRLVVLVEHFLHQQWRQERDRMADGTLLRRGADHGHVAEFLQFLPQRPETGSIDAVVVGQQDAHANLRYSFPPPCGGFLFPPPLRGRVRVGGRSLQAPYPPP